MILDKPICIALCVAIFGLINQLHTSPTLRSYELAFPPRPLFPPQHHSHPHAVVTGARDRKITRLKSNHVKNSYAEFFLKKKYVEIAIFFRFLVDFIESLC